MLKDDLLARINFTSEYTEVLGPPRGSIYARKCYNVASHKNDDKTPSLTFSPEHGGYRCHACDESGDIFTLYMKVRGMSYPQALDHLLAKYGLEKPKPFHGKKPTSDFPWKVLPRSEKEKFQLTLQNWTPEYLMFMYTRYGLTSEDVRRWFLGINKRTKRLEIPVFLSHSLPKVSGLVLPPIVNIRKHDVFRRNCKWWNSKDEILSDDRPESISDDDVANQTLGDWEPVWSDKLYKTMSIAGHGKVYLYPIECLDDDDIMLVGGELKALLLRRLGINAATFTGGEGSAASIHHSIVDRMIGKNVKVIMDPDQAGIIGSMKLAKILATAGAIVQRGVWNPSIPDEPWFPRKGDITDLLRVSGWNPAIISDEDFIKWEDVDREYVIKPVNPYIDEECVIVDNTPEHVANMPYAALTHPSQIGKWINIEGIISGKDEIPYAVPSSVTATCQQGQVRMMPKCASCGICSAGFKFTKTFTTLQQVDFVGTPPATLENIMRGSFGVPRGCAYPNFETKMASVDKIVLSPPIRSSAASSTDDLQFDFKFARRQGYLISSTGADPKENEEYKLTGRVIADPKKGSYSFAITRAEPVNDSIFNWTRDPQLDERLKASLANGVDGLIEDLRYNRLQLVGMDKMILGILLSWFLPFKFKVGPFEQARVCPSVLVLGDTLTGKSTVTQKLMRMYGIGRYASGDSKITAVGLIGGNISSGRGMSFSWGLLPISHRGIVAIDEFNKIGHDVIGALTNLISSGIAERITATGVQRAMTWVRLLYLANPVNGRDLRSFSSPIEAAYGVMGSSADLGRLEYVIIQKKVDNDSFDDLSIFNNEVEQLYTDDVAQYHLGWAWSLTQRKIHFENQQFVFTKASILSKRYFNHTIFLPAIARFKLARVAVGFASLLFSCRPDGGVFVKNEHVMMAVNFFHSLYDEHLIPKGANVSHSMGLMPEDIIELFNSIPHPHWRRIRMLSMATAISMEDLIGVFGSLETARKFLELAHFKHALLLQRGRYYYAQNTQFHESVGIYCTERESFNEEGDDDEQESDSRIEY